MWLCVSVHTVLNTNNFYNQQCTAIFTTHEVLMIALLNVQEQLYIIEKLLNKWKIHFNESKSLHVTFPLRNGPCPAVNINYHNSNRSSKIPCATLRLQVTL